MSEEERGPSQAEVGERSFDHTNAERMNRHFAPTVNNEHAVHGYIKSADMEEAKAYARIQLSLDAMASSDFLDPEEALLIQGGKWTADRMCERGRDGFERKIGQTEIGVNYETTMTNSKGGWFRGLLGRNKKEENVTGAPR